MRLCDAMRLGSMLRPQIRSRFWEECGSCALGAAAEAIGLYGANEHSGSFTSQVHPKMMEYWPWLTDDLVNEISDLNFLMTREKVADWVERYWEQTVKHHEVEQECATSAMR